MCRIKGEGLGSWVSAAWAWFRVEDGWVGVRGFGECRKCNGAFMLDERRRRKGEELGMLRLVVHGEDGLPPVLFERVVLLCVGLGR